MRGSDSIGRSPKKANGRIKSKLSGKDRSSNKSNGTPSKLAKTEQVKTSKSKMGNGNSVGRTASVQGLQQNNNSSNKKKSPRRKSNKQSPELRPRRRASQTYFFKYQLARNPLKAEEEDLKLALLASLQQCNGNSTGIEDSAKHSSSKQSNNNNIKLNHKNSGNSDNTDHTSNIGSGKINHNSQSGHGKTNGTSSNKQKGKKSDKSNNPPPEKKFKPSFATTNSAILPATPTISKTPPDEDYLEKYKPETEDFLAFICFRNTAPNFQDRKNLATNGWEDANNGVARNNYATNGTDSSTNTNTTNTSSRNCSNNNITNHNNRYADLKHVSIEVHNLKRGASSPGKSNCSPTITDYYSPNSHRRPTRQSPRLASSQKRISENDNSIYTMGVANTAYDNSMNYEEDMKRASIALEDMAQEINSSDGMKKEVAQNSPDCISKLSCSPYKNNKHLVKGLMTREFAGAFADEETIFESISNHKL